MSTAASPAKSWTSVSLRQARRIVTIADCLRMPSPRPITTITGGRNAYSAMRADPTAVPGNGLLTATDVRDIFRLTKVLDADLARRSAELRPDIDYERLAPIADRISTTRVPGHEVPMLHLALENGLFQHSYSHVERLANGPFDELITRHLSIGMRRIDLHPAEMPGHAEHHRGLLDAIRAGDPEAAATAAWQLATLGEQMAVMVAEQLSADADAPLLEGVAMHDGGRVLQFCPRSKAEDESASGERDRRSGSN